MNRLSAGCAQVGDAIPAMQYVSFHVSLDGRYQAAGLRSHGIHEFLSNPTRSYEIGVTLMIPCEIHAILSGPIEFREIRWTSHDS